MILQALMEGIYWILDTLFVFDIPNLPTEVYDYISTLFDYLVTGAGILANYTPLPYLLTLFFILLSVDASILIYHLVMWIIRKIPMAGMS